MVVYDIETRLPPEEVEGGWDNPAGMGFGAAVAYGQAENQFYFYTEPEPLIQRLENTASSVITFNGLKFDNAVLLGNDYRKEQRCSWWNIDLLSAIVCAKFDATSIASAIESAGKKTVFDGSLGLDAVSRYTTGMRKIGHGAHAPQLIREGRWAELWQYCLHDVRMTIALYHFIRRYGYVVDGNQQRIEVTVSA